MSNPKGQWDAEFGARLVEVRVRNRTFHIVTTRFLCEEIVLNAERYPWSQWATWAYLSRAVEIGPQEVLHEKNPTLHRWGENYGDSLSAVVTLVLVQVETDAMDVQATLNRETQEIFNRLRDELWGIAEPLIPSAQRREEAHG